ncbi:MAG: PfkB domain protein [Bacilli bacterium]|nr:PfkB domain protein [Bacilli bacterium]
MKPAIAIFGNIFVDLKGIASGPVYSNSKNVGCLQIVHGGAARNAAHNLAILGADIRFISSYTADGTGSDVFSTLEQAGVDVSYLRPYPKQGMGRWVAVLNGDGELIASVSEQPSLVYQEETILDQLEAAIQNCQVVGLDIGISKRVNQAAAAACRRQGIPLYGLVGNLDVLTKDPSSLGGFHTFVCNLEEAEILVRQTCQADSGWEECALYRLAEFGPKCIVLTMAEQGAVYLDTATNTIGHVPALPVKLVDSTGAGDSFFAGLLYAAGSGMSLCAAVSYASSVAAQVVAVEGNILKQSVAL